LKTGLRKLLGARRLDLRNPGKCLHTHDTSGSLVQREQQQTERKYHECVSYQM
jgi:hypothetical protein